MNGLYTLDGIAPVLPTGGDVWIAPGAAVIGQVTLGRGVGIWFNAVLRGDTEPIRIGDGSNVQEGSVLHTDAGYPLVVGRDCTIGHMAMLHGCTIGDTSLIGMAATVLNGARIGSQCLIGARSLVTEGKEIPDGTLVMGAPARVVRDLTPEERARLAGSARHYQANMRRFAAGLAPVR
jgi:carbonic anhydrase/acetyltransferase-like protein (isoleucine patch superfamily)